MKKRPSPEEAFEIKCQLLPLATALAFIFGLIALTVGAWLFTGGAAAYISIPIQIIVVAVVSFAAIRLKVKFDDFGMVADSTIHKDSMFQRPNRSWDELYSVRLHKLYSPDFVIRRLTVNRDKGKYSLWDKFTANVTGAWGKQGFLVFDFRSGGTMPLPIAGIPDHQLEELFVALARWADPMALNADVISLQRDVLMGETVCLTTSYTRMWEEDLRKRFEVTNFVPLPGGHKLRDGEMQVLMQLACGGMSSVYLARLSSTGERIVLKELVVPEDRDGSIRERVREMFDREAKMLARLDHPQIVKVYDHFVEDGRNYLVLQHARGLTFRQQVELNGVIKEKDVIDIAKQLTDIVGYLHEQDPPIIHRDITPDNLVFDSLTGRVTLIDFGAANEFVGHVTGTLVGKQSYLPPEQFRGKAEPASDIYAIGSTMFFLLTGEDPQPITVSSPIKSGKSISNELNDVIEKATAQELEDRIRTAPELAKALKLL